MSIKVTLSLKLVKKEEISSKEYINKFKDNLPMFSFFKKKVGYGSNPYTFTHRYNNTCFPLPTVLFPIIILYMREDHMIQPYIHT